LARDAHIKDQYGPRAKIVARPWTRPHFFVSLFAFLAFLLLFLLLLLQLEYEGCGNIILTTAVIYLYLKEQLLPFPHAVSLKTFKLVQTGIGEKISKPGSTLNSFVPP